MLFTFMIVLAMSVQYCTYSGLVFITSSVVTMAKTLRDSAEAGKLEMLQREVAQVCNEMAAPLPRSSLDKEMRGAVESLRGGGYWYFQSIAMLAGSVGMTLYGLFQMPIKPEQRRFTALGKWVSSKATIIPTRSY